MKNSTKTKTGPRVKAMYIAALDTYEAKKDSILAKYLKANEKVQKSANRVVEESTTRLDKHQAEAMLKTL